MNFFLKIHIKPDLLMGDLDSLRRVSKDFLRDVKVITFPFRKDKTDLQLAFEYCMGQKAKSIDIVVPTFGKPDHFLGNIMLVNLLDKLKHISSRPKIRFVNVQHEIIFVKDSSETFVNCRGDIVSVIPLTRRIELSCRGTEYDVHNAFIRIGDTRGLRNRIVTRRATFDIKGAALIVHQLKA